jgi:ABC-type transport system involved in multi-copper enzyme maturation permease subunit
VRHWLTAAGGLAVLVVLSLPAAGNAPAAATGLLPWAAGFYVCFLVPLLAFVSAAGAMRDDLRPAAVDYLFTRPMPRPQFVAFRFVTQLGVAQLDFLLPFLTVAGLGLFWSVPDLAAALPTLLLGQIVAVTTFTAAGLLCGLLTSRYVIAGVLYGAVIEVGAGNVPTQLNHVSLIRHVLTVVEPLLGERAWALSSLSRGTPLPVPLALLVLTLVAAAAVALTAAIFSCREFSGSTARDA